MTDDAPTGAPPEPAPPRRPRPDPSEYDTERNAAARARGLAAPYIQGGRDPEPEEGLREERYYLRLLLFMVVAIVAGGFVIGILISAYLAMTGG
jgi:hypothetical protein